MGGRALVALVALAALAALLLLLLRCRVRLLRLLRLLLAGVVAAEEHGAEAHRHDGLRQDGAGGQGRVAAVDSRLQRCARRGAQHPPCPCRHPSTRPTYLGVPRQVHDGASPPPARIHVRRVELPPLCSRLVQPCGYHQHRACVAAGWVGG